MSPAAIRFEAVDVVFGSHPDRACPLVDAGLDAAEIAARTGQTAAVMGASLAVMPGEILVLMGLSGSGKSTLLRTVNGLNRVTRGAVTVETPTGPVRVDGATPAALRSLRRGAVAMVFQQFGLIPWRSVRDNVALGLEIAGVPRREIAARVADELATVGLADWAEKPVSALSGGMQQRVGLARAFATGAPILLMDEPFSALDPIIRRRLQDELLGLEARHGRTILFVSHDLDEAIRIGDRIAVMEGGRIVQVGTPADIVLRPATPYVAEFTATVSPLAVLTARDLMRASTAPHAATVPPDAPAAAFLDALASGLVAVSEGGRIVGEIAAADILSLLARK